MVDFHFVVIVDRIELVYEMTAAGFSQAAAYSGGPSPNPTQRHPNSAVHLQSLPAQLPR